MGRWPLLRGHIHMGFRLRVLGSRWPIEPRRICLRQCASRASLVRTLSVVRTLPVARTCCFAGVLRTARCKERPAMLGATRRDHSMAGELARSRGGCDRRPAAVHGCAQRGIAMSLLLLLALNGSESDAPLVLRGNLRTSRPRHDAAGTAIEAYARHVDVVDHRAVVDVGDVGGADVGHRAVVVEVSPMPVTARVADAGVAEAVVDAAVE